MKRVKYPRTTFQDYLFNRPVPVVTFEEGLQQIFPKANLQRLERWKDRVKAEAEVWPEILLFQTLVCGAHFRITHPDIKTTLSKLYQWLTWHPRNMDEDLAELVIEAFTPGLIRALDARGWRRGGTEGSYVRKKGRPPTARGAWIAGLVVEEQLRQYGAMPTVAISLTATLIAILQGRRNVSRQECYTVRRDTPKELVQQLSLRLEKWYEHLLIEDGRGQGALPPPREHADEYGKRKERHRGLHQVLYRVTADGLTSWVLARIPKNLLAEFEES